MEGKHEYLHGTIEATIFHATPARSPKFPLNLASLLAKGKPAYVTMKLDDNEVAKTTRSRDRTWNQTFQILCAHPSTTTITFALRTPCKTLGSFKIPARRILDGSSLIDGLFPLTRRGRKIRPEDGPAQAQAQAQAQLRLLVWFRAAESEAGWERVIRGGGFRGLRDATFPLRSGCDVTLYQDAHHCRDFRPPADLCGSPGRVWEDVYKAIEGAKCLVYITGWAFNPNLVLVRDPETEIEHGRGVRIGELLKRKADEGVAVRIMIWDDETSLPVIRNPGIMQTHGREAEAFFRRTRVVCRLCPRLAHPRGLPSPFFTHHQKTISADCGGGGGGIVSFLGGLDLCEGRYDTDCHSLFRTLSGPHHEDDFYQVSIPGASKRRGGPREPWHDSHARLSGPAALDVLSNFEQRWACQLDPALLVPRHLILNCLGSSSAAAGGWDAQVFRSIDSASAGAVNEGVERSVEEAYVEAVRRAERFVYVENQYFIGGSHLWGRDGSACRNLVPAEIALRVAAKIRAGERFAAYVVLPMWPEGAPGSKSVGDILHWTRETVSMMYGLIAEAIAETGGTGTPRDYLTFFCLGNREAHSVAEFDPPASPRRGTDYWKSQTNRRFMVYVHSKLMIVDDLYLLIGSANINQRSMDGQRDTEIAVGCYQPHRISDGDVRAFRMSLWYEHTRLADPAFLEPESLDCARKLRAIGDHMWHIYTRDDQVVDMEGVHLMTYPINVTQNGVVEDLGQGLFPDTNAPVKGKRSKILPPIFTT